MPDRDVNPMSRRSSRDTYRPAARAHLSHAEGVITQTIEQHTARIPSSVFLVAALSAMTVSAVLELAGRTRMSRFVGMWPPSLLLMGVYNKLVKSLGTS
jgi:hypothetical protein